MNTWAVLLAAGRGARLAGHHNAPAKQFIAFEGAPLFWRSALTFSRLPSLAGIVFVFAPELVATRTFPYDETGATNDVLPRHATGVTNETLPLDETGATSEAESLIRSLDRGGELGLPWRIAAGGERRQDSVAAGLAALPSGCDAVLVHDSARPFASASLMQRVLDGMAQGHAAVIPGIAVADTMKSVDGGGLVLATHERSSLRAVQTPQGFLLAPLRTAHEAAVRNGWQVTDDAALFERLGLPVLVVEGEEDNRKITTPGDLALLDRPLSGIRLQPRFQPCFQEDGMPCTGYIPCAGFGYDVHRYGGERPFILGGVPIACNVRISAHSDGDTLLHALMDALLGCMGLGDIGALFPDSDPAFDNIASGVLLAEALEKTAALGLVVTHVDITVIAQTPRIAPHREAIAANIAKLLRLARGSVNVKATTEEGLGFTGEKKGIKVTALVSGMRPHSP